MRLFLAAVLCLFLLAPSSVYADGFGLDMGAEGVLVLPMSEWSDTVGPGFGFTLRGEKELAENLHWSARIGYLQTMEKEHGDSTTSSSHVPLLGGIKYQLLPKFFVTAETGFFRNEFLTTVQQTGFTTDDDDSGFDLALSLGAGYQHGVWDFRAQFLCPDLADLGEMNGLLITAGYHFKTF
jgi:hypothetical protein